MQLSMSTVWYITLTYVCRLWEGSVLLLEMPWGGKPAYPFFQKRSTLFMSLQPQLLPATPSLKSLCPTCWTVRNAAIQSLLDNCQVLCEALGQINQEGRDEYAYTAVGMLSLMEKLATFFEVMLSQLLFAGMDQLSITLQHKDLSIQEAVSASKLAVLYLERQTTEQAFEKFYSKAVQNSRD